MRHRVAGRKLSRHTQHRELMFRNMVVSLLTHERIKTTLPKAKELRSWADKIVTLGKKGDLAARRRAFDFLRDRDVVKKLFEEIAPRFKDRQGGYTRIYKDRTANGRCGPSFPDRVDLLCSPGKGEKEIGREKGERGSEEGYSQEKGKGRKGRKRGEEREERRQEGGSQGQTEEKTG